MTSRRSGLWGAGFPLARSIRNVESLCNQYCWSLIIVLVDSEGVFLNGASTEVILQDVEKAVWMAVDAVSLRPHRLMFGQIVYQLRGENQEDS